MGPYWARWGGHWAQVCTNLIWLFPFRGGFWGRSWTQLQTGHPHMYRYKYTISYRKSCFAFALARNSFVALRGCSCPHLAGPPRKESYEVNLGIPFVAPFLFGSRPWDHQNRTLLDKCCRMVVSGMKLLQYDTSLSSTYIFKLGPVGPPLGPIGPQ